MGLRARRSRRRAREEPPSVWFGYTPDRKGCHPAAHLAGFEGVLQTDGHAGYTVLYASGQVGEAARWAHVRRKFYEVDKASPGGVAAEALGRIGELYGIEAAVRGSSIDRRRAARQARAGPVLTQTSIG